MILLVEDDTSIVSNLSALLAQNGFPTDACGSVREALSLLSQNVYDLLLLDLSLPDGSGFSVCAAAKQKDVPVLFLSASDSEYNVVAGLEMGAEDYIAKPFRPMELVSRVRTVLRRRGKAQAVFLLGGVQVDAVRGVVTKAGRDVVLSALEYRLLLTFVNNRGKVLTRDALLGTLWDAAGDFVNDNTLTVYIKRLREKIEDDPANPTIIRTVRGLGYKAGE